MGTAANAVVESPEEAEHFARITRAATAPSRIPTFPTLSLSSKERNDNITRTYDADLPLSCIDVAEHQACIIVGEVGPTVGLAAHIIRCVKYCAGLTELQLTEQNAVQVIAGAKIDRDAADMHYRQALANGERALRECEAKEAAHAIIQRSIPSPDDSDAVADIHLQKFGLARNSAKVAA